MRADLNVIFASALAARPVQRHTPSSGTLRWRDDLHFCARRHFTRTNPGASLLWYQRSRFLIGGVPPCDPRWAVWATEFRVHLAQALRVYRNATPVHRRPSRAEAFAIEGICGFERNRIFWEER